MKRKRAAPLPPGVELARAKTPTVRTAVGLQAPLADPVISRPRIGPNNSLYYGDNLEVLRKHIPDKSVDLCYIDPPFNSNRHYFQIYNRMGTEDQAQARAFIDTWIWDTRSTEGYREIIGNEGNRYTEQTIELIKGLRSVLKEDSLLAYLVSMTSRITEIFRALKPTGSFYLHCDPTASHYLKLVCDAIFLPQGGDYKNQITWKRTSAHSTARRYGSNSDNIFFYTKSGQYTWNVLYTEFDAKHLKKFKRKDPDGRMWYDDNLTGAGLSAGITGEDWRGFSVKALGRHWGNTPDELDRLADEGKIYFPPKGGFPRFKRYLDESKGVALQEVWDDIYPINSQAIERLGYPTQKPLALLQRIISASSNPNDTVLDAYCGCGTTIVEAERLKRKWIGIDITYQSISLVLRRLEKSFGAGVLQHITLDGIPRDMESAVALANKKDDRLRKEFEKWALLTYTNNRAIINEKKGADRGIDGVAFFLTGKEDNAKVIFQVKSGGVQRGDIATLRGDMEREAAAMAILITLESPTAPMKKDAKSAGLYRHEQMGRDYDKIQIVTIEEIVEQGVRLDIPMSLEVLRAAKQSHGDQLMLPA